jgi:mono/diheme cytochrome c family protein
MTAKRIVIGIVAAIVLLAGIVIALNLRGEERIPDHEPPFSPSVNEIERGAYLARAGNCAGCHTARGGAPYAGGVEVRTPFGTVVSTNLTPDRRTGIGTWTPAYFWRALHNGRSKDGRLLYPAFPYPNYTQVTREDSDALFAYLSSLPPVDQRNRPHALRFPYNNAVALAVWRALFFEPGTFEPDTSKPAAWNRGAYLVHGLGHCVACHSPRNAFGATTESLELSGGLIPMLGWYAPSLASPREAGVADWDVGEIVALLTSGVSKRGSVMGPMAEVVFKSTQYLSDADARAMAVYLKSLPQSGRAAAGDETPPEEDVRATGADIYKAQCAGCHGDEGEGALGAYPALAGNRAVTMDMPANVIRIVLSGGYLPATRGNPRPYGMPPFAQTLDDASIAAVVSYIRSAWGNRAAPVSRLQVMRAR